MLPLGRLRLSTSSSLSSVLFSFFLLFGEKYSSFSASISDGSFNETNYYAKLFNAKERRMGF